MFAFEIAPVIADVYNSSLIQGVFPHQLKLSIVRPIPKALPPTSMENDLRPRKSQRLWKVLQSTR